MTKNSNSHDVDQLVNWILNEPSYTDFSKALKDTLNKWITKED